MRKRHVNYFSRGHTTGRSTKFTLWQVVLHVIFSWQLSLCRKWETLIALFQKYWWSKNPTILLDKNTFSSVTWNCVYYIDEKILLFLYKLINLSFSIIFNLAMPPRLPKGTLSKYIQPKVVALDATFHVWIFPCKKS